MPRTARLTDALHGRTKVAALVGAVAALAGAGTASAATMAATTPAAPAHHAGVTRPGGRRAGADDRRVQRDAPSVRGEAAPARPYEIYDSTTPSAIPAGHPVATYADGAFAVSPGAVAGKKVVWIDTNGSDPKANALDVEPGDVTPSGAGTWAAQKLHADPAGQAIIYTMKSDWAATRAAVDAALPASLQSHVRWWIADPTGVRHLVPGSSATQWYWGSSYDISTAAPGF
jgi:hypothetical protein